MAGLGHDESTKKLEIAEKPEYSSQQRTLASVDRLGQSQGLKRPPPPPSVLETNLELLRSAALSSSPVAAKRPRSCGINRSRPQIKSLAVYKNPMEFFNHIFAGSLPTFNFEDFKAPGATSPTFKAWVVVNGCKYEGSGSNKKDAKQVCAYDYIRSEHSSQLAESLMNLYRNQNSGQNTTSPVVNTARDLNHLANYSPETTHLGLNEGEEKTAYLFRLFGSKLVFSDPKTTRTRHGQIVSINLFIQGLPESGLFKGEGPTVEDAQEHASALAMRMLKKYPKIVQQLEEQASNKAASYNFATDVTEPQPEPASEADIEAYWAGDLNTCGNQTLLKTAAPQYKLSQLPPKAPKAEALEARLKEPNSNPVMVLNEIAGPAVQFYFIEERGEKQQKEFVLKALFNGEEHFATGRSKKDAKFKAACAILQKHFGVMNPANVSNTSVVGDEAPNGDTNAITHFEFANQMQKLVKDKFMELTVRSGSNYNKYKVIAGIVMTTNEQWDDYQLISVTTGTKTIKGENLSMSGTVLHDCHAEILSKRCLRKFLYSQLNSVVSSGSTEGSILEEIIIQNKSCGYRVKSGVRFHLYINTTPCGDARIFSPHEVDQGNDAHPDRKNRGLIRVKIEAGEGTIPSTNEDFGTQTFDGVLAGERLLNLSCSDKVLRMNVLGMQGGLLSWFLEPVYLSSIVIGSFYHADHLERAVISRFKESSENDKKLAAPFRLSRPMLCSVDIQEARQASKSLPYSMNWTCVDGDAMEIVDTSTGKLIETSVVSSISKQSMFGEFKALLQTEISVRNTAAVSNDKEPRTYRECKSHSTDYIKSKKEFIRSLQQSELGQWLTKPQEVDSFT